MNSEPDKNELGEHLFLDHDDIVPIIAPSWPQLDHKWIQEKFLHVYEETGFVNARDYYRGQIDFWTAISEDFEESYEEEKEFAKQQFRSQTLN